MGLRHRLRLLLDPPERISRLGAVPGRQMGLDQRRLCLDSQRTVGMGSASLREMVLCGKFRLVLGPTPRRRDLLVAGLRGMGPYPDFRGVGSVGAGRDLPWSRLLRTGERE